MRGDLAGLTTANRNAHGEIPSCRNKGRIQVCQLWALIDLALALEPAFTP